MGGNDGILVRGDTGGESDIDGVGKWGRGMSDVVGETLALSLTESPTSSRNGISGDSGVGPTSFSFAFSCWYWIQAATSALST